MVTKRCHHITRSISTIKKYKNVTKIVADGAVQALIEHDIKPDILVTDLDGDMSSIKIIGRSKIPIIVHAHGNNYEKLELVTKFQNKIGTTQTRKFGRLENFGGFTDGDRCVFLAENLRAIAHRGFFPTLPNLSCLLMSLSLKTKPSISYSIEPLRFSILL